MGRKLKPIVKNFSKFNKIKLASGIDLSPLSTQARKTGKVGDVGISTKRFGSKWFVTENGRGLFKTYDGEYGKEIKKIRIVNEMLCYYLATQVGIDCAKYEPAHYKEKKGLISYDILKKDEKLVTLGHFLIDSGLRNNIPDILEALDDYEEKGFVFDRGKILEDVFKIAVFDIITMQTDRNSYNLNFIFTNGGEIRVSPLFDNELAFDIDLIYDSIDVLDSGRTFDIQKLEQTYANWAKTIDFLYHAPKNRKNNNEDFENLCTMAKASDRLSTALSTIMKKLNISQAIKDVESLGYVINDSYKEYVKYIVKRGKQKISNAMKGVDQDEVDYVREEIIER